MRVGLRFQPTGAGRSKATFTINARTVTANTTVTITAKLNSTVQTATLTVTP